MDERYKNVKPRTREAPNVQEYPDSVGDGEHIRSSDIIDPDDIYVSPELEWTWSYTPNEASYLENKSMTPELIANLNKDYTLCTDAWFDLFFWIGLIYGDIFGNRGIHTTVYYLWNFIFFKVPQWATLCGHTTEWGMTIWDMLGL